MTATTVARTTAARVAAGGVARAILAELAPGLSVRGCMVQMGPHRIDRSNWDWDQVEQNPFWTPDARAAGHWASFLLHIYPVKVRRKELHFRYSWYLGVISTVLLGIAETLEGRVDRQLGVAIRLMEPALLLFLAVIVLFIFLALVFPMMQLSSSL